MIDSPSFRQIRQKSKRRENKTAGIRAWIPAALLDADVS
jgi:hypothetical protein